MTFEVPSDGKVYQDRVFARCRELIKLHIWSGIKINRLNAWINNFDEGEERYFAACLLDSLLYRSEEQTISLLRQLFQRAIPNLARESHLFDSSLIECTKYFHRDNLEVDPMVRLVPVINSDDPYSKSGPTIIRKIKRDLQFSQKWEIRPEQFKEYVTKKISTYIFIDDFLGTGIQFGDFLQKTKIDLYLDSVTCIYSPLVAHETGMEYLSENYPALKVTCVEYLEKAMGFFSTKMPWFEDGQNTVSDAQQFYYELLQKKKINIKNQHRRGFGGLDVAYAFQHAAPDNSIPLFWWNNTSTFRPLFDR